MPLVFSKLLESRSEVSLVRREMVTVLSVTFVLERVVGQMIKIPHPDGKCFGTSLPLQVGITLLLMLPSPIGPSEAFKKPGF